MEIGHGASIHKIGPKMDNISFEISQIYFDVFQIEQNLFELFQIGAKNSKSGISFGSVSGRFQIGTGRSVCSIIHI